MDDSINEEFMYKLKNYLQSKTNKTYFRNIKFTPDNIQVTCPFHKGGQETKPSASIRRVPRCKGIYRYVSLFYMRCYVWITSNDTADITRIV